MCDKICSLPRIEADDAENNIVGNTSNIDQGPEIGHTGHYLGAVIGGPIGGAVGLALLVLVWLMLEKRRQCSKPKSMASPEGSKDPIMEQSQHCYDLESQHAPGSADRSTDGGHKKKPREITPYWGDL